MVDVGPLTVDIVTTARMYEKGVLDGIWGILVMEGCHCVQTMDIGLQGLASWILQDGWTIVLQMLIMGRTEGRAQNGRTNELGLFWTLL